MRLKDLEQAYHLGGEIKDIERQLQKLETSAEKEFVGDSVLDYRTGQGIPLVIRGYSDNTYKRQKKLAIKLAGKKETLLCQKAWIEEELDNVADAKIRRIIRLRFFERKTWDEVAAEIDGSRSGDAMRKCLENFLRKK